MPYTTRNHSQRQQVRFAEEEQDDNKDIQQESYEREQPEYFAADYKKDKNDSHTTDQQQTVFEYQTDEEDEEDERYSNANTLAERVERMLEKLASKISGGNAYGTNSNGW